MRAPPPWLIIALLTQLLVLIPLTHADIHAPAPPLSNLCLQDLYKQISWPLYKLYGHAFEAFKLMVADDGAAIIKRLEEERGPLTVFTPQVNYMLNRCASRLLSVCCWCADVWLWQTTVQHSSSSGLMGSGGRSQSSLYR
jgi:hypothetical protein